jgi:hypothetical protein
MVKGAYPKLAVLVLAAGALLVGQPAGASAAANDKDAAVKALKRQLAYVSDGQYDRAYRELHPSQQAIVTQACYVGSAQSTLSGVSAEIKDVKKVYRTSRDPGYRRNGPRLRDHRQDRDQPRGPKRDDDRDRPGIQGPPPLEVHSEPEGR